MKPIADFVKRFNAEISLDGNLAVLKEGRYYLLSERLKELTRKDFFYAGAYLGKEKNRVFFPSFILLARMAAGRANRVVVDDRTAWLFIVGRDVFKRGIVKASGSVKKGDYTLILNEHSECLGFGKILRDLDGKIAGNTVVVKNIADIGDFLRRER